MDCSPASIGEFWYNEWIAQYLSDTCKDDCKHIQASSSAWSVADLKSMLACSAALSRRIACIRLYACNEEV